MTQSYRHSPFGVMTELVVYKNVAKFHSGVVHHIHSQVHFTFDYQKMPIHFLSTVLLIETEHISFCEMFCLESVLVVSFF